MLPNKFSCRRLAAALLPLLLASCGGTPGASPGNSTTDAAAGKTGEFSLLWRRQTATVPDFARISRIDDNGAYCTVSAAGGVYFTAPDGENIDDSFFQLPSGETYAAAACGGDIVAAVNRAGTLHVYSQNGEALWSDEFNTLVIGAPVVKQGRLLVLGVNGRLAVYAAKTGELLWQYLSPLKSILNTPVDSAPAIAGTRVYIGVNNGGIGALDFSGGQSLWENAVSDIQGTNPVANIANVTTPLQQGDTACAAAYQSGVSCFAADSGNLLWNAPLSATRPAAGGGGRLFVADNHNVLRAYDINGGKLLWEAETPSLAASAPLLVGEVVFVGGQDGMLRAFSAEDGEELARFSPGGGAIINLQAAADGGITALTAGGGLSHARFQYE